MNSDDRIGQEDRTTADDTSASTEETGASRGWSRRDTLHVGATLGLAAMIDSILTGCKTRGFNTSQTKKAIEVKPTFDKDPMVDALLIGTFMERWNDIGEHPEQYPLVKVHIEVLNKLGFDLGLKGGKLVSALRTFLILFRVRANPIGLQEELMREGIDVVWPGDKGPAMVLSHNAVTGTVLNPDNTVKLAPKGSNEKRDMLMFQLAAYRPEMTNLTRHYILCDDDIERHNEEKAYQHKHAILPTDGPLVARLVHDATDKLVADALARSTDGTIDIVTDVARWVPMKVVDSYFGLPCGDAAPELLLDNNAIPLYQGIAFQKGGVGPWYLKVSEEQMYKWIANSFRNSPKRRCGRHNPRAAN